MSESGNISTDYITTAPHPRYTFECRPIRKWVEKRLQGRVLNACAGETKLAHDHEIVRNDIDKTIDANTHLDVAQLASHYEPESFDTIVFDPPWTLYQANLRYDGQHVSSGDIEIDVSELPQEVGEGKQQVGHARLAKDGFNYLLKPGGTVIQLSYSGCCMPARLNYQQIERIMIDPVGEGKTLIGSVDKKSGELQAGPRWFK